MLYDVDFDYLCRNNVVFTIIPAIFSLFQEIVLPLRLENDQHIFTMGVNI